MGGGTGQIKLRYVYDMFVARFGGARSSVDLGFAPTGTEWRLTQQAENRFRDTKALLAEE